eukprot:TRINITY_DN17192_c0_g1_i1.p1 TRINITY_DN17192_c0_g1~~TRINITY_DN17192_c0_g1_i1.p1  ORF type:complete len:540 (-),score=70.50 TRINITY_DN17192_c0_g1_i1:38-1657(-)
MLGSLGRRCREDRNAPHCREDAGWPQCSEEEEPAGLLPASHAAFPAGKTRKSCRGALPQRQARFILLLTSLLLLVGQESRPALFVVPSPRLLRRGRIGFARRHAAGGADKDLAASEAVKRSTLVQAWGVLGVAFYLSYGVKKVVPIVRDGIGAITSPWQWGLFAATLGFFGYVEGYKGFQLGFCPRVVSRAWAVSEDFEGGSGSQSAKELFKRYGSAYLMTSITLSLISYTLFYELIKNGVNVAGALSSIGITLQYGKHYGAAALAYVCHKAASPIRFPPTVLLTEVVARWMGKDVAPSDAEAEKKRSAPAWHKALAPAFCIGYFHGTKARVISSWAVTSVIFLVVVGVRRLPNPYRAILDAGVIVGLMWGIVSVLAIFAASLRSGKPPKYDPSLPKDLLVYSCQQAASPIRFPPTVLLTEVVARWMGKDVAPSDAEAEKKRSAPAWHKALAPAFCIGYFHGTKARVISSWAVTSVIFLVVVGVRRLPNPYRAILDAGVIVGLMWGIVSVLAIFAASLRSGKPPKYDPSLPKDTPYHFP